MARTKRLVRTSNDRLPEDARQYVTLKNQVTELSGRIKDLRDRLIEAVADRGYEGEGGHVLLDLDEPIEGIKGFKREKRIRQSFREEELLAFLKDKDLYDDCVVMVPTIDGDALSAAVFEGKISEAELNRFVDEKVTYALVMEK